MSEELHILSLPLEVLEEVFTHLSFQEVARIRVVCRRFLDVANGLLSLSFHMLDRRINLEEERLEEKYERGEGRYSEGYIRLKYLIRNVRAEYSVVRARCWRYIQEGVCYFFAGEILDHICILIRISRKDYQPQEFRSWKQILKQLSAFTRRFLFKFDPSVRDRNLAWDVVKILDCSLNHERIGHTRVTKTRRDFHSKFSVRCVDLKWLPEDRKQDEDFLEGMLKLLAWLVLFSNRDYLQFNMDRSLARLRNREDVYSYSYHSQVTVGGIKFLYCHETPTTTGSSRKLDIAVHISCPIAELGEHENSEFFSAINLPAGASTKVKIIPRKPLRITDSAK